MTFENNMTTIAPETTTTESKTMETTHKCYLCHQQLPADANKGFVPSIRFIEKQLGRPATPDDLVKFGLHRYCTLYFQKHGVATYHYMEMKEQLKCQRRQSKTGLEAWEEWEVNRVLDGRVVYLLTGEHMPEPWHRTWGHDQNQQGGKKIR